MIRQSNYKPNANKQNSKPKKILILDLKFESLKK